MGASEERDRVAVTESHDAPGAIELGAMRSPTSSRHHDPESSPLAWLCVLGSFMFLYPSYGFMQSVGTVQSYLQLHQLSEYSTRDLGWISGIFTSLALFLGIQAGPLMDAYGTKWLAPISVALYVPVFFIMGECTQYWHFILCLGVLGGIGGALTSTVAVAVIGKLFNRRKGLAMGVALSGSSFGGVTISMMLRSILPRLGWQWSMRIMGFLVLGIMVLGVICFLPYPRLSTPVSGAPVGRVGALLNFSAFRSPPFGFMAGGLFMLEFVLFGITGLLPTFAIAAGFPSNIGFSLVAILNGTSCFGRIMTGVIGDRIGHLNILLIMIGITIVFTGVVFVPFGTKHIGALYAFAALWGYGSGSFLSSTPVCLGKTCEPKDYGRYLGTMNFVVSFSLLVTVPIGGQMLESMGGTALSGFYLAILFLGGVCYFAARSLLLGGWLTLRASI
ncbi:major facilitator superfamily transporter [Colletotrichum paranaense]|uniref:Major facilitator superfamily transporter n=2 Tax=Colletotrichum acutatum species complex TaxID=2707335 RepID=A0AAI9Z276_9PEZI|nr:major facilitator superfamily transporter [Colletotrichum costaricense]XP_060347920.1 major facilitator superfamily transporter [Colletotrichum paranaense]KAI3531279.1 major facilitator superfamily transporter [Colletotrichum filicis]KAK1532365.1 major facilitator superfamily transporter [Colletotrichum costaricense]KAK1535983.1 major facilitator superfamily transporter [Colletotrichum paranaense]